MTGVVVFLFKSQLFPTINNMLVCVCGRGFLSITKVNKHVGSHLFIFYQAFTLSTIFSRQDLWPFFGTSEKTP